MAKDLTLYNFTPYLPKPATRLAVVLNHGENVPSANKPLLAALGITESCKYSIGIDAVRGAALVRFGDGPFCMSFHNGRLLELGRAINGIAALELGEDLSHEVVGGGLFIDFSQLLPEVDLRGPGAARALGGALQEGQPFIVVDSPEIASDLIAGMRQEAEEIRRALEAEIPNYLAQGLHANGNSKPGVISEVAATLTDPSVEASEDLVERLWKEGKSISNIASRKEVLFGVADVRRILSDRGHKLPEPTKRGRRPKQTKPQSKRRVPARSTEVDHRLAVIKLAGDGLKPAEIAEEEMMPLAHAQLFFEQHVRQIEMYAGFQTDSSRRAYLDGLRVSFEERYGKVPA